MISTVLIKMRFFNLTDDYVRPVSIVYNGIAVLIISMVFLGCVQMSVFEKNEDIDPDGWKISDSIEFAVDIQDTLTPLNFIFSMRHNTDYEFSNIYFFINTTYPNNQYSRDTIQLLLAGKDGEWYGEGFGKLKEVEVMLKEGVVFPMKGTYLFRFTQAMRTDALTGVEDVGIRLEKTSE